MKMFTGFDKHLLTMAMYIIIIVIIYSLDEIAIDTRGLIVYLVVSNRVEIITAKLPEDNEIDTL